MVWPGDEGRGQKSASNTFVLDARKIFSLTSISGEKVGDACLISRKGLGELAERLVPNHKCVHAFLQDHDLGSLVNPPRPMERTPRVPPKDGTHHSPITERATNIYEDMDDR